MCLYPPMRRCLRVRAISSETIRYALDAIQLASALVVGSLLQDPTVFVSSDRTLLTAAAAEGYLVDDPMVYP